jgi:SAM-dependent methyltransferase
MKCFFILLFGISSLIGEASAEKIFTNIYENHLWGEEGSGGGSRIENAKPYVDFLQKFLCEKKITSVVDVGCGDWQFSKFINWKGIRYFGIDVVKYIIENNTQRFGSPTITFIHSDGISNDLPEADLMVCKEVLQHLTNADVFSLIKQLGKFKYCLITNDVDPHTLSSDNHEIIRGSSRTIDLTKPPFNIKGEKVLTYYTPVGVKQILLIQNRK